MHHTQPYQTASSLSPPGSVLLVTTFSVTLEGMGCRQECPSPIYFVKDLQSRAAPHLVFNFFSPNFARPMFETGKPFCAWKAECPRVWMSSWLRLIFLPTCSRGWSLWVCSGAKKSGEVIYLPHLPPCMTANSASLPGFF